MSGISTSVSDTRNDAKRAILDLVIRGIQFDQLLSERTGSEEFLVSLWKEIGLPLPAQSTVLPRSGLADGAASTTEASLPAKEALGIQKPASTQSAPRHRHTQQNLAPAVPPYGTVTLQHSTPGTIRSSYSNGNQQPIERSIRSKSPLSSSFRSQLTNQLKDSSSPVETKISEPNRPTQDSAITTASAPAQEERKDRIARLMAQKALKSAQPTTLQTSSTTDPMLPSVKKAPIPSGLQVPNTSKDMHGNTQPLAGTTTSPPKTKGTSIEARTRARGREATALALRKIEEQRQIAAAQKHRSPDLRPPSPRDALLEVYDPLGSSQITTPFELSDSSPSHNSKRSGATEASQNAENQILLGDGNANQPQVSELLTNSRSIPGLFMTSPVEQSISQPQWSQDKASSMLTDTLEGRQSRVKPRLKRPVAADFDVDTMTNYGNFKRPFGQVREEPRVVIDVSDDDSSENEDIAVFSTEIQKIPALLAEKNALPATRESVSQRQNNIKDLAAAFGFSTTQDLSQELCSFAQSWSINSTYYAR